MVLNIKKKNMPTFASTGKTPIVVLSIKGKDDERTSQKESKEFPYRLYT